MICGFGFSLTGAVSVSHDGSIFHLCLCLILFFLYCCCLYHAENSISHSLFRLGLGWLMVHVLKMKSSTQFCQPEHSNVTLMHWENQKGYLWMDCIKICADKVPLIREERSMGKDMLSLLEIFISYVSEIVILWYCFSFFYWRFITNVHISAGCSGQWTVQITGTVRCLETHK